MTMSSTEPHSVVPDPRVRAVLDRLHAAAEAEMEAFAQGAPPDPQPEPEPRPFNAEGAVEFFSDKYISLEREQGNLLYLLARSLGARRAAEFGTSFGVSTALPGDGDARTAGGL